MSGTTFTYFNGRGLGELIRMTLVYIGQEFTEVYLTTPEEVQQKRQAGHLLFQQPPMLEIDGKRLVQSGAILRYLARRGGIYGNNNEESTRIDELFEGTRDFYMPFTGFFFKNNDDVMGELKTRILPRYLPIFDKVLQETGSGYLVGSSVTLADLGLLEALLSVEEYFGSERLNDYVNLRKFLKRMKDLPNINKFLTGSHRKPMNTAEYVATCKFALSIK